MKDLSEEQEKEYIKRNLLALAKDHKNHCDGSECGINLFAVRMAFTKMNITLSKEESEVLF